MSSILGSIQSLIENAGSELRRTVPLAVSMAIESGSQQEILRELKSPTNLGSRWLRAALTERVYGENTARPLWTEVVDQNGCEPPDVMLHRAKMLARSGDINRAAAMIRIALQNSRAYDLYIRAETVARKCRAGRVQNSAQFCRQSSFRFRL